MDALVITHDAPSGTLLDGTSRGDGVAALIKPLGWRWSATVGAWYLPGSRDRAPRQTTIAATTAALAAAGHLVDVTINADLGTTADREARLAARSHTRVTGLTSKAERAAQAAAAADARLDAAADQLPPGGEPIKVGHHSEARHRRALDRVHAALGSAAQAHTAAKDAAERVSAAASHAKGRTSPVTVANRIARLEAELRAAQRTTSADVDRIRDELDYWTRLRADQIDAGAATNYGPDTIKAGDLVKIAGHWREVVRVNRTTVSVATGYSWTDRAPYAHVQAHRAIEQP